MRQFICVVAACCFTECGLAAEPVDNDSQARGHEEVLEQINRDWDFRRSKLAVIRLVVDGSRTVRKGMSNLIEDRTFPPSDHCSPYRIDETIDFVGRRIRKLSRFDVVDATKRFIAPTWVTHTSLFCSDGQVWWESFRPQERDFQGGSERSYDAMTGCEKRLPVLSNDVDILFLLCTFAVSSNHRLDVKPRVLRKLKVQEIEETNHGRIVRLVPTEERWLPGNELVINLDRQSAVTGRTSVRMNGQESVRETREIQYDKIGDLWVSTSWTCTEYIDGKEAQQTRMKVVKFDPEPKFSDDMFCFSPRPGMKVRDLDAGETYVMRPAFGDDE
jgi:hypothetical protein